MVRTSLRRTDGFLGGMKGTTIDEKSIGGRIPLGEISGWLQLIAKHWPLTKSPIHVVHMVYSKVQHWAEAVKHRLGGSWAIQWSRVASDLRKHFRALFECHLFVPSPIQVIIEWLAIDSMGVKA